MNGKPLSPAGWAALAASAGLARLDDDGGTSPDDVAALIALADGTSADDVEAQVVGLPARLPRAAGLGWLPSALSPSDWSPSTLISTTGASALVDWLLRERDQTKPISAHVRRVSSNQANYARINSAPQSNLLVVDVDVDRIGGGAVAAVRFVAAILPLVAAL